MNEEPDLRNRADEEPAGQRGRVAGRPVDGRNVAGESSGHERHVRAGALVLSRSSDYAEVIRPRGFHAEQERPVARLGEVHGRGHSVGRRKAEFDARSGDPGQIGQPRHDSNGRNDAAHGSKSP